MGKLVPRREIDESVGNFFYCRISIYRWSKSINSCFQAEKVNGGGGTHNPEGEARLTVLCSSSGDGQWCNISARQHVYYTSGRTNARSPYNTVRSPLTSRIKQSLSRALRRGKRVQVVDRSHRCIVLPRSKTLRQAPPLFFSSPPSPRGAPQQLHTVRRAKGPPCFVRALPLHRPPRVGGVRRERRHRSRSCSGRRVDGAGWRPSFAAGTPTTLRTGTSFSRRISCAVVGGAVAGEACRPSGGARSQRPRGERMKRGGRGGGGRLF